MFFLGYGENVENVSESHDQTDNNDTEIGGIYTF